MPRGHAYHAIPTGPSGNSMSAHGGVQCFTRQTSEAPFSDAATASDARFSSVPRPQSQSRMCAFACICLFSSAMGATAALFLTQLYSSTGERDELPSRHTNDAEKTEAQVLSLQRKTAVSNDDLAVLFAQNAANGLDEVFTAEAFPQWRGDKAQGRRSLLLNSPFRGWNALQILDDVVRVTAHLTKESLAHAKTNHIQSLSDSTYPTLDVT